MNQPSDTEANGPLLSRRTWQHTIFNVSAVAACAFIAPGLWAAMNGLGGAGSADPYYVNAANSVIFCLQLVICIFGSTLIAKIGLRWAFAFGMTGFPLYAASVYCNVKYGNTWFLMAACAIDGITSGIFWLTEGAVVLAYPEKNRRGKYLAYWLASRIVGQMVGGAVTLGVNATHREAGHISVETYLVFISIQVLGPFVASLLSPPHKVQRADHTPVTIDIRQKLSRELRTTWEVLCRKEILLLLPMMFQSVFSEAFFSTYNTTYFTVRSPTLSSLVASGCVIICNFVLGFWLDWHKPTLTRVP
ncbi:hypothetical protein NCS55_00517100 [Fusarium keratoplasticum]|nr:hypothetical protein NCS55_00517100 [Fusarium keratoplasticum]